MNPKSNGKFHARRQALGDPEGTKVGVVFQFVAAALW
jgi:hypothetical protein